MSKIGFLHPATVEAYVSNAAGFARGLKEVGFAEATNVAIDYRFANGQLGDLSALAADLAREAPAVIVAGGAAAAMAAAHATSTIPIVFVTGHDPVRLGLVASLANPGGNITGATFATTGSSAASSSSSVRWCPLRKRSAISGTAAPPMAPIPPSPAPLRSERTK